MFYKSLEPHSNTYEKITSPEKKQDSTLSIMDLHEKTIQKQL